MDPLLRLTLALSRLTRHRWTRLQAAVALGGIALAVGIVLADHFGFWPDWMRAQKAGGIRRW